MDPKGNIKIPSFLFSLVLPLNFVTAKILDFQVFWGADLHWPDWPEFLHHQKPSQFHLPTNNWGFNGLKS